MQDRQTTDRRCAINETNRLNSNSKQHRVGRPGQIESSTFVESSLAWHSTVDVRYLERSCVALRTMRTVQTPNQYDMQTPRQGGCSKEGN